MYHGLVSIHLHRKHPFKRPAYLPASIKFEVRAADLDRNIDASPAYALFEVMPAPIASRVWFIPLVSLVTLCERFSLAVVAILSRKEARCVYTGGLEVAVKKAHRGTD